MLKDIAVVALKVQSYLVTEDVNKRLNSSKEVFEWLVTELDSAICRKAWHDSTFAVVDVIRVYI